jgi:hypothetical protein
MWVGLDQSKVAVDKDQRQRANKRRKCSTQLTKDADALAEALKADPDGGMRQVRGAEGKGEDKKRVTVMHRLILKNLVQTKNKRCKPKGELARTVLVLPGKHANADYFSFDEHGFAVWNRDWDYEDQGKPCSHKKGEKLGNSMIQLQHIKKAFPGLMERFLVLQQPAAYRDAIIVGWCMEDLHKKYPYVLQQHDLLGAQATTEVKQLRHLWMQPECLIAGNMTDCLQLTDIMIANVVKGIARRHMPGIRKWMKAKAKASGEKMKYTVGSLEVLLIAEAIDKGLQSWMEEYDFIFAAARQGGHLAYLPDLEMEKLITVEEAALHWPPTPLSAKVQAMSQEEQVKHRRLEVPALGGGKIDASWLANRYEWLDSKGVPVKPNWKEMDDVEWETSGHTVKDGDVVVPLITEEEDENGELMVTKEEQSIFDEHSALLQQHPTIRKKMYSEMLQKLDAAKSSTKKAIVCKGVKKTKDRRLKSAKMVAARSSLAQEWKRKAALYLGEGYTPEQMASRVVLQARKKQQRFGGKQQRNGDSGAKICKASLKDASAKWKVAKAKMKKDMDLEMVSGPMVGRTVRLKKDTCL